MRGSTLLGWLLIGPIVIGVLAMLASQATGVGAFALVAQIGLSIAVAVIALAFLANLRASRRRPPPPA